jgi:fructose-1,6-bisphosphatase II
MERNLSLELVRVTEAAALSCGRWVGKGDKNSADAAATNAMRKAFDNVTIDGIVVIGEGEMDEAPMLYIGERLGNGEPPLVDIAVDPLEGTNICAKGVGGAIATIAVAPRGGFLHAPDMYMDKIVAGAAGCGVIDINLPAGENVRRLAKAKGCAPEDLTVAILDRERHAEQIADIRRAGARIKLMSDGDVAPAIAACVNDSGVDLMLGIGGAPEGVLAAAAVKCLKGCMQGRLVFYEDQERERAKAMGIADFDQIYTEADMSFSRRPGSPMANCCAVCGMPRRERARTRSSCAPKPTRCAGSKPIISSSTNQVFPGSPDRASRRD